MDVPASPSVFQSNSAGEYGGGLFMYSTNPYPVLTSVPFTANSALLDGGGAYLRDGNTGATFTSSKFDSNTAVGGSGGGVAVSSGHMGLSFSTCSFTNNMASAAGGGCYVNLQNGQGGELLAGNELVFDTCSFEGNNASTGGALSAVEENTIAVYNSYLAGNKALGEDSSVCALLSTGGGAVALANRNTLTMKTSIVQYNYAGALGGGITSEEQNTLYLTNTSISFNRAVAGGGSLALQYSSAAEFCGENVLQGNEATGLGGAIFSLSAPLWSFCSGDSKGVKIIGNKATYGSALFFSALTPSSSNPYQELTNLTIRDNEARLGGTVYWVYNAASMPSGPLGLQSDSLLWENNTAPYGVQFGTQATSLQPVAGNMSVPAYSQSITPAVLVTMHDYYNQSMPMNASTNVFPSITSSSDATVGCSGRIPNIAGKDAGRTGVPIIYGQARFASLEAYCAPSGNLSVTFTAELGSGAGIDTGVTSAYDIAIEVVLLFRACEAGEFEQDGLCLACNEGSYSLQTSVDGEQTCSDCTQTEGIYSCHANQLIVDGGYWRRYQTSAAVIACPAKRNGCNGGNLTGNSMCDVGYEGALCAVCSAGYYPDGAMCSACGGSTGVSPSAGMYIAIACVIGMALIAYLTSSFWGCKINSQEREEEDMGPKEGMIGCLFQVQENLLWVRTQYSSITSKLKLVGKDCSP